MKKIVNFFKKAFKDIKNSAKDQLEVDKAQFKAIKEESTAKFIESTAMRNSNKRKSIMKKRRDMQIADANERILVAINYIETLKHKS